MNERFLLPRRVFYHVRPSVPINDNMDSVIATFITWTLCIAQLQSIVGMSTGHSSQSPLPSPPTSSSSSSSALTLARALTVPRSEGRSNAEFDDDSFWDENDLLIERAWIEYGHLHEELFDLTTPDRFEKLYVHPSLREAARAARDKASEGDVLDLFERDVAPGVHASSRIFTDTFRTHLVEELDHRFASGIPIRRPNGMNRYGAILSEGTFAPVLNHIIKRYIRPTAMTLFPEYASRNADMDNHFAFVVRYNDEMDMDGLAEHMDASVVTMNVCLGKSFEGSGVEFRPRDMIDETGRRSSSSFHSVVTASNDTRTVALSPGLALFHHGQHRHRTHPLRSGERINMIVWLYAPDGFVRVSPYDKSERLGIEGRWGARGTTPHSHADL